MYISVVSYLYSLFFNIHFQGCTPLHTASIKESDETVRLLLLLGADMDIENREVRTSMVFFFIVVDYLFSKHAYLSSIEKMISMKMNTQIQYGLFTS